jgi:RNA polymerase sigma factor (sigma-70 family)
MTDEELAAFRAGDSALFGRLVVEMSPRLLGAAMTLTGDRARAHDLVQDTWVRAFEARESFESQGSLLGWLFSILRTRHHAEWRSEARRETRALVVAAADDGFAGDDPLARMEESSRRAALWSAVSALPTRQRDVVVLRIFDEHSVSETARRLGIAEGTVKSTLSQAIARLRTLMGDLP